MKWLWPATGAPVLALALGFLDPPYERPPAEIRADAALVLSGDVDYLRTASAVGLLRRGAVKHLLFTGCGIGGDSAVEMSRQARREGVPAEAIVLETTATTTHENIVRSLPIIQERGWRRVAIVTSSSHMGRALRVAARATRRVSWIPSPVPDAGPRSRIYQTRLAEWTKLVAYASRGWL